MPEEILRYLAPAPGKIFADGTLGGRFNCLFLDDRENIILLYEGAQGEEKRLDGPKQKICISHGDCLEDAEWLRDELRKAYPTLGRIEILSLGIIIGAHCGPGLLTVFYFGDKRKP